MVGCTAAPGDYKGTQDDHFWQGQWSRVRRGPGPMDHGLPHSGLTSCRPVFHERVINPHLCEHCWLFWSFCDEQTSQIPDWRPGPTCYLQTCPMSLTPLPGQGSHRTEELELAAWRFLNTALLAPHRSPRRRERYAPPLCLSWWETVP